MDGIELAAYTRQHFPHTRIVVASGYPVPSMRERQGNQQPFTFVNKPYRLADLARALRMAN
jgi:CheY-like chemotaxis protein